MSSFFASLGNFATEALGSFIAEAAEILVTKGVEDICNWITSDTPDDVEGELLTAHSIAEPVEEAPLSRLYDNGKCPICLDSHENKYHPPCGHVCCFKCLVEWSHRSPTCPLCKLPFDSIKHSIRSENNFKVHLVPPIPAPMPFRFSHHLPFSPIWSNGFLFIPSMILVL